MSEEHRGYVLLLTAAFFFSLMSLLVKLAGLELPVAMLVLARGVVTLVLSYGWLRLRGIPPWGNDRKRLFLRGVFGVCGLSCFFFAVTRLPLAEVTVLHYLNPIVTSIAAAIFLREALDRRLVMAIVAGLSGTILVVRPSFLFGQASALSWTGVVAALGGAVFSAGAYTTMRRLRLTDDPNVVVFYFPVVAVPVTLPFALSAWVWPSASGWLLMLGLGVATQIAQIYFTRGLALVSAGRGTTIGYVQIVFAAWWGYLFFDTQPGVLTMLGALCVAAGVVLLFSQSKPAATA